MPDFYPDLRNIGRFRFALVDASLRDGIPAGVQQEVIAPAFLGEDTDRCPTLIALDSMPSSSRVAWCDELHSEVINREESRASLLIESDSSLKALASHMARRMALQTPGRDRPLQWRYFDPGTALQMPRVLGHVGLAWLMAPAKAWMVPWAGSWQPIAGPNDASQQDLMRFKLQSEHIAALMRVSVINRTLLQNDKPLTAQEWVDGSQQLDAIVVQGQTQHKLDHRDDLVAYAFHPWTTHLRILVHPHMQGPLRVIELKKPAE